jgi:hypothetical protein
MKKLKNPEFECLFAHLTCLVMGFVAAMAFVFCCSAAYAQLTNEESVKESSRHSDDKETPSSPMGLILGLRGGAAFPTEKVLKNTGNGTSVGPLVNAEALYALREWVRVGMMLEWHQHSINLWGPKFGTLSVFSILPTVEFRPDRETREYLGWESFVNHNLQLKSLIPYASLGAGANVHSFSNSNEVTLRGESFSSTFALRVALGFDIAIDSRWAFNTELAWNRDSGTYKANGLEADFNASTLNLLMGVRAQF